jgi:hypothetical protein
MLASITPLGERSRRQHWPVTVASLTAGAVLAGAGSGALLRLAGGPLPLDGRGRLLALAAVLAAGLLLELGVGGLRLPTHLRQVDERWLHRYRGFVYGFGFGAQFGAGVATVVTTSAVYAVLAAELLAPTVRSAALVGAAFGAVRGLTVLAAARVDSPHRLAAFHRRFDALDRPAARAVLAGQALLLVAAAGLAA